MFLNIQESKKSELSEAEEQELLSEAYIPVINDRTYIRNPQYIIVTMLDSMIPRGVELIDPDYLAGGISEFTFTRVKEYFTLHPFARRNQLPFHYYSEIFQDNYLILNGCPRTSSSWYLEYLVDNGLLDPIYIDSFVICLQENYYNEPLERNLMEVLANDLLTPMLREFKFNYNRIVFLEDIINREKLETNKYYKHIKEPRYLHKNLFQRYLMKYSKR